MLPQENVILLSYVNTKLRDEYQDLDALCEDLGEDRAELEARLNSYGYFYDETRNRFLQNP